MQLCTCICTIICSNSRTAVPQIPSSPIFSLQIDPLPADPNTLVNYPIMMMFDVVCNSVNKIFCIYTHCTIGSTH